MAESLQDRLRDHAKAFDGLLSLIPAKMYYGEDTTNQWNKKKQTKQEAAAARRAKLDPDSELNRNAKEVMDERAKNKRKAREMEKENDDDQDEWEDYEPVPGVDAEKPGEGLKKQTSETNKKQKLTDNKTAAEPSDAAEATPSKLSKKDEKKAAKKDRKKEKKEKKEEKKNKKVENIEGDEAQTPASAPAPAPASASTPKSQKQAAKKQAKSAADNKSEEEKASLGDGEVEAMDVSGLAQEDEASANSSSESQPQSPTFDTNDASAATTENADPASATTSISSTVPPSEKPKGIKIPADTSALRARLAAKIEALRAARKADGPDGKPIRTRQELIESRRRKQELRKAHKQELRKQAKLEEVRKREEALASSSPGVMSPAVELDEKAANFAFGRIAFGDGAKLSHDLSYVLNSGKKKGPSDVKTALIKVQNQKKRLEELDPEKRADIQEKEAWLTARRRIEGEKIRDDEALLKRAVKRKEVAKRKSEKAWKDRSDGVKMAQKQKQKKREENLQKKRDDKLLGKAGKKKKKGGATGAKKKARPGFEGSLGVGGRKK